MKKLYFILLIILIISGIFIFFDRFHVAQNNFPVAEQNSRPMVQNDISQNNGSQADQVDATLLDSENKNPSDFQDPLDRAQERVTKKPFGIYITSQNSPVQPERFQGYHTGADFEIFPEELNIDVPVKAVCSGKLLQKKYVSGYGGVAIESCELNGSTMTIIYGHLKLTSISKLTSENINSGEIIGIMGADKSTETDGERKHLHLGMHRGSGINIRGYVGSKSELSVWIDPCQYVCSDWIE